MHEAVTACLVPAQPIGWIMRHMSMVLPVARRALAICLVSVALASCTSDPSPNELDRTEAADPGAMSDQRVHQPPTSLRVVNDTSRVVVLTSADGQSTASIGPGKSLQLASKRVCKWIPLTASTTNGRFLDKFSKPCSGQTWTITDLGSEPKYSIEVKNGVPGAHASIARVFIRFATAPTPAALGRVPIDATGVTITLGRTEKHLPLAEVADAETWYLTDNGGTTSALFVISNTIKNAHQGDPGMAKFLVSHRPMPVCAADDLDDPDASKSAQVFIALLEPDSPFRCAVGFRIGLEVDAFHAIQAVRLAVRTP